MTADQPRLLYVVTEDWYFWSHRLPMARAAREAGYRVGVATRVRDHGTLIRSEGFDLYPIPFERASLSPVTELRTLRALIASFRSFQPDLVHTIAMKPVIYGSIAAWLTGRRAIINALAGMGSAYASPKPSLKLIRPLLTLALRFAMWGKGRRALVQNPDDRDLLIATGICPADKITLIPGSGVDLSRFVASAEPAGKEVIFAYVGRMLAYKGVRELIAAFKSAHQKNPAIRLWLAGTPDPENPTSLDEDELRAAARHPAIDWLGFQSQIERLWPTAHVAVLFSSREGVPLTLLEAAACARPCIAADAPGSREVVRHEETGLLVPLGDIDAYAAAMLRLAADRDLRVRLGEAARALVEASMSSEIIGRRIVDLYESTRRAQT